MRGQPGEGGARAAGWASPLLLGAVGIAMAAWTWGTWLDVVVDFGRELYVPWRLSEGSVLYRDVAWFDGPLSPYWNALWFSLFGVGVRTVVLVNLTLVAAFTALLHRLLTGVCDRLAAGVACLVFLLLFAFIPLLPNGSYNWVAPYSHEATHGVLLAVASLACLGAFGERGGAPWLAAAGALLGLTFLTKASVFVAGAAGSGLALALLLAGGPGARRGALRQLSLFAVSFFAPIVTAFLLLAASMPAAQAVHAILGSWPSVLAGEVADLAFYRRMMGLDDPAARLATIASTSLAFALVLAPAFALSFVARGSRRAGAALAAGVFFGLAGLLFALRARIPWLHLATPLPLFVLLAAGCLLPAVRRGRSGRVQAAIGLAFAVFCFALLGRMLLNARFGHYGFSLAAPATMLCVAAAASWIPAWIERRGGHGRVFRAGFLALLGVLLLGHLEVAASLMARQDVTVGSGADAFRANARGQQVNRALAAVAGRAATGATLATLPEGVMLNYLARLPAPTRFVNFMPPELLMFGEAAMVEAFSASPPSLVLVVHKDTSEYGARFFGQDYGRDLHAWIRERYEPVETFGKEPLTPGRGFGIGLLAPRP